MKRFLLVASVGILLASIGSSCAQPRFIGGGGWGYSRPFPQQRFIGPPPGAGFVRPPVVITPRPRFFNPRPWGWGNGWRRGGRWGC